MKGDNTMGHWEKVVKETKNFEWGLWKIATVCGQDFLVEAGY